MLFFRTGKMKKQKRRSITYKENKKFAPLQVRSRWYPSDITKNIPSEKRALSWTSCSIRGSLSLEAAMCLSLFLFLSVCLIVPMKMMDRQRQIQAVAESVGEELSRYAYVEYSLMTSGAEEVDLNRADGEEALAALGMAYAAARILEQIDNSRISRVSFAGTDIGTDDMVHIVMKYNMNLPFSVFGLDSIPVEHVCSRRMWTGAEGGRHNKAPAGPGGEEEETVYIGKNSTRYHRQRTCHYLYNNLETVAVGQIDSLRNQSGGRYGPCKTCGTIGESNTVYIMPYGTSYHTLRTCSSIIAYVQAVPLSQVVHLGACSYCGGR